MAKFFTYSFLAAAMSLSAPAFAEDAAPVKLFSFTVGRSAVESEITIGLSTTDSQSISIDWGDGTLSASKATENYDVSNYTNFTGTIAGTKIIVYGTSASTFNAADLSWAAASGVDAKIKSIDLSALTGLTRLELNTNALTKLDLTNNAALKYLDVSSNELTELILPENSALTSITASNTFNTNTGEVTNGKNEVLATDWGKAKNLATLKLNGNSKLGWFDSFDISQNKELATLEINGSKLSSLDVTHLTKLKTFNAAYNEFTTIDLSKMVIAKATINLKNNKLKEIVFPEVGSTKMTNVNLSNNELTFASLPKPGITATATRYVYSPQATIVNTLDGKNFADYASLAKVGDTESVFKWMAILGDATEPTELSIDNAQYNQTAPGVFRFDVPVKDLYGEITNSLFPNLTLKTTKATSMGLFPKLLSLELTAEPGALEAEAPLTLTLGSSAEEPQNVYIDWGDGTGVLTTLEKDDWDEPVSINKPVSGNKIEIYGDPTTITSLSCNGSYDWTTGKPKGKLVSKADVSALTELTVLDFKYNLLSDIDLTANKKLTKVVLNSNKISKFEADLPELKELDLDNYGSGADKKYGDNKISTIDFSKLPKLTTLRVSYTGYVLDFTKVPALENVYSIANGLTSVDLSQSAALKYLTMNHNKLTTLDATGITGKANIFATNNQLESVTLVNTLGNVNLSNNNLTFATLPATDAVSGTLYYSPQNPMTVTAVNGVVDLASQAKVGDKATVYTWKLGEETATEGFTANEGVFTFSKGGEYVCEMTNEAFPDLTLKTNAIAIEVQQGPSKLFSFTVAPEAVGKTMTLNISSTDNQSVQVDWGNGTLSNPVATQDYAATWEYGTPTGKVAGTDVTVYGSNPATINKLDLAWDKESGVETKMMTIDLKNLTGVDDITLASNALTSLDLTGNVALAKLFINGNNITDIKFPENCALTRIEAQNTADAGDNNLFKVDLSKAPKLNYLILSFNNKDAEATTINLDKNTELATFIATDCNLETIDVTKLTKLSQLTVNNNNLKAVDVSSFQGEKGILMAMNNNISSLKLPAKLRTLNVKNNKLTFATLPAATVATNYTYDSQKPMTVEVADGKVDLTSQAKVGDVETVFAWTANSEEFKDFTVANGMITFTKSAEDAVCSMTNAALPKLTLTTIPVNVTVDGSGVADLNGEDAAAPAEFYNLQGVKVSGTEPGIYIRRQGNKTEKVIVR